MIKDANQAVAYLRRLGRCQMNRRLRKARSRETTLIDHCRMTQDRNDFNSLKLLQYTYHPNVDALTQGSGHVLLMVDYGPSVRPPFLSPLLSASIFPVADFFCGEL